jgi:catechol 2,3-dioxygenase-like lactoylglutathione lyase family enzyme
MAPYVAPTEQLVVEIFVRDAARAKSFYEQLGFEILADRGSFVVLSWEGHELFLDERRGLRPLARPAANMRVMVPDVDRHWAQARKLGARVVETIGDREYGLRDFTIADPDGFGVRFGTELMRGHGSDRRWFVEYGGQDARRWPSRTGAANFVSVIGR